MTASELRSWLAAPDRPPVVMGVLNLTPDSFSDGGEFASGVAAVDRGLALIEAGADWLDLGAESTRPGAVRVPAEVQLERLMPVLSDLRGRTDVVLSIDTTLSAVAQPALDAGADLINDISGGRDDPFMFALVAERAVPIILMHMQGEPATMQRDPHYQDVVSEVREFLLDRMSAATESGVNREKILLDPGIGFGKSVQHNLALLRNLKGLAELGRPLVVGTSRKGFVAKITSDTTGQRIPGTAATVAWSVANQAAVVRVHDVEPMARVVRMIQAILTGSY